MIFAARLSLVLLAAFGLATLLLSALLALAWHTGLGRARLTSGDLLAARLFPVGGGLIVALTGVLPAFLLYEPAHEPEAIGPLVIALALLALATLLHGAARGGRACLAARRILRDVGSLEPASAPEGKAFAVVDAAEPIVAVVGGWRPRIIAARSVLAACEPDEWRQVLAHEAAHVVALDNLKFLLLLASPDALAWTPLAASLKARWRAATEFEADERAAGGDPRKRIALASALLKVARLSSGSPGSRAELSISVASADVEARVRRLLRQEPSDTRRRLLVREALGVCALLIPLMAVPLYPRIQDLIELLVSLGS